MSCKSKAICRYEYWREAMRKILPVMIGVLAGVLTVSAAQAMQDISIFNYPPADPSTQTEPESAPIPREVVDYEGSYSPGTIIVNTEERRLYFVLPDHQAMKYGVGVGRPGFEWTGVHHVAAKREWPDWTPPSEMLKRRPDLPLHMAGGIDNPLGARALYVSGTLYRIHGSNEPDTIGQAVSSGCIRMTNDDVTDLYERAKVGAEVIVE
jgi:lipoprotein-anchoring transpeptidase ErfK/SrfK